MGLEKTSFIDDEGVAFVSGAEGDSDDQMVTSFYGKCYNIEELVDRLWSIEPISFKDDEELDIKLYTIKYRNKGSSWITQDESTDKEALIVNFLEDYPNAEIDSITEEAVY